MKILIIENDLLLVEAISLALRIRWPEATFLTADLGERGIDLVESENPDIIILDLGLPDISGFEVLKQIRLFSDVPILILTVRADEDDVIRGLKMEADDYVVKPFRKLELLSRIEALTTRRGPLARDTPIVCGKLRLDASRGQLFYGEKEINLTPAELNILRYLMKNAGHVVTHSKIAESLWGQDYPDAVSAIRVHIRRLRKKLEPDARHPQLIQTRAGIGYLLIKPD